MGVEIYSTPACGQCQMAKNFLKSREIPYTEYTVGKDVEKVELETRVGAAVRSVPQIFIDDQYVGGYQDLVKKIN